MAYDAFISYARADQHGYAEALAEARSKNTAPRIDIQETAASRSIPVSLWLAIVWSRILVVVATPNAIGSPMFVQ